MSESATASVPAFRMDGAREVLEEFPAAVQIRHQVEAIEEAIGRRQPAVAFDMAKTLIETTCKTVLNDKGVQHDDQWECPKLLKETLKQLQLVPDEHATASAASESLRRVGQGLATAVQGLCELRNHEGAASHGRDAFATTLGPVQAELAARAADAVVRFLWSVHRDAGGNGDRKRFLYEEQPEANDWIDTVAHEEPVLIFETPYRQSEILFKLDPDAYRAALTDYEETGTESET